MAEKKKYNSILISGRKDETLTYSRYIKDEESGESVKETLDKKVNVSDKLETQQIKDGAITNEKLAADSVGNTNLQDGSVSNEKLEDESITNEKLAENSITKDKLKDNTIGVEKLDPELRQTINAATGLPENLVETIQNVDDTLKDHQSQLNNKQSQIDDNQKQITANDEDISLLQTRSTQMEETIKSIAATGGASQATAVTYNNEKSGLTAVNAQTAIDEVDSKVSDLTKDTNIYNISNRTKKKYTIDGTRQVERLYINTYPANDGNITLTLNGDSKTIFVSGGENTEENRKALAASIAALNFKNWFAEHDNTGVLFTYNDIGATLSRSVINSENTGANIKIGIIIASSVSVLEDIPTEFKNGGLTISFVNAITNCISIYRLRTEFWTNDFNAWEDVTNYDVVFPAYKKIIEPNLRYYLDSANSLAKSISFDNNNIINVVGGENTAVKVLESYCIGSIVLLLRDIGCR